MTPTSMDSAGSLSPLDLLAPPPPRSDAPSGDSFARHLQPPPAPAKRTEANSAQPSPRSDATPPPAQTSVTSEQSVEASSSPREPSEPEVVTCDAGCEDDAQSNTSEVTEDIAAQKPADAEEEVPAEAVDPTDELLLQTTVVPPPPPPEQPVKPAETNAEADAPAIAPIAEDESPARPKSSVDQTKPTQAAANAANHFELQPSEAQTKTEVATPQSQVEAAAAETAAKDAEVAAAELATTEANAVIAAVASDENRDASQQGQSKQSTNDPLDAELDADADPGTESPESTAETQLPEVSAPIAKARDGKRDRHRGEARTAASGDESTATTSTSAQASTPTATLDTVSTTATAALDAAQALESTSPQPTAVATPTSAPAVDSGAQPQRMSQHLLARATQRGSAGAPANPADNARFVARVAKAFQMAQSRDGELQLRLSPPALGSLKLEIKVQSGVLTARVEAENAVARSMLIDNLPALKERLAEQGIQVEKFDVDLMDRQPQGQPDSPQERERRPSARTPHYLKTSDTTATTTTTTGEARPLLGDGRLNVTA